MNSASDTGSMTRCGPLVTTYCVPIRRQVSARSCRKLLKKHEAHLLPVAKLSEILVILDETKHTDKQVTTSGGKLRIEKSKANNQFALSGATFLAYLETLLYGYVLCAMTIVLEPVGFKTLHRAGRPRDAKVHVVYSVQCSNTTTPSKRWRFETATSSDPLVITPHSFGGQGKDLIIAADLVIRTEMFRINTLQPTLTGGEVMASVLTSACCCDPTATTHNRAAHLPSHQQLVDANRRTYVPTLPKECRFGDTAAS